MQSGSSEEQKDIFAEAIRLARKGDVPSLQAQLIESQHAIIHMTDHQGKNLLMHAAAAKKSIVVYFLLQKTKIDVNALDHNNDTALAAAALSGDDFSAQLIADKIKNITQLQKTNKSGMSASHIAKNYYHDKIVEIIHKRIIELNRAALFQQHIEHKILTYQTTENTNYRLAFEIAQDCLTNDDEKTAQSWFASATLAALCAHDHDFFIQHKDVLLKELHRLNQPNDDKQEIQPGGESLQLLINIELGLLTPNGDEYFKAANYISARSSQSYVINSEAKEFLDHIHQSMQVFEKANSVLIFKYQTDAIERLVALALKNSNSFAIAFFSAWFVTDCPFHIIKHFYALKPLLTPAVVGMVQKQFEMKGAHWMNAARHVYGVDKHLVNLESGMAELLAYDEASKFRHVDSVYAIFAVYEQIILASRADQQKLSQIVGLVCDFAACIFNNEVKYNNLTENTFNALVTCFYKMTSIAANVTKVSDQIAIAERLFQFCLAFKNIQAYQPFRAEVLNRFCLFLLTQFNYQAEKNEVTRLVKLFNETVHLIKEFNPDDHQILSLLNRCAHVFNGIGAKLELAKIYQAMDGSDNQSTIIQYYSLAMEDAWQSSYKLPSRLIDIILENLIHYVKTRADFSLINTQAIKQIMLKGFEWPAYTKNRAQSFDFVETTDCSLLFCAMRAAILRKVADHVDPIKTMSSDSDALINTIKKKMANCFNDGMVMAQCLYFMGKVNRDQNSLQKSAALNFCPAVFAMAEAAEESKSNINAALYFYFKGYLLLTAPQDILEAQHGIYSVAERNALRLKAIAFINQVVNSNVLLPESVEKQSANYFLALSRSVTSESFYIIKPDEWLLRQESKNIEMKNVVDKTMMKALNEWYSLLKWRNNDWKLSKIRCSKESIMLPLPGHPVASSSTSKLIALHDGSYEQKVPDIDEKSQQEGVQSNPAQAAAKPQLKYTPNLASVHLTDSRLKISIN